MTYEEIKTNINNGIEVPYKFVSFGDYALLGCDLNSIRTFNPRVMTFEGTEITALWNGRKYRGERFSARELLKIPSAYMVLQKIYFRNIEEYGRNEYIPITDSTDIPENSIIVTNIETVWDDASIKLTDVTEKEIANKISGAYLRKDLEMQITIATPHMRITAYSLVRGMTDDTVNLFIDWRQNEYINI